MSKKSTKPHGYAIWGMHGGYFLTQKEEFAETVRVTQEALAKHPNLAYNMEIEAFTLDRLQRGAQLRVEQEHCDGEWQDEKLLQFFRDQAQDGRMDNVSTYTQPFLYAIDGEAVVRQFGYARRIQRDTLGIGLDYYGAQEPCWCGQIPAILRGFNMKGCAYETSWGLLGFAPMRDGESFRWRGPDGSEIPTVTSVPSMRDPWLDIKEHPLYGKMWVNPCYNYTNAAALREAQAAGLEHPAFLCLSLDFTHKRGAVCFDPTRLIADDCEFTFTTLGPYLAIARDDGLWDDAFAEFTDRMCWGIDGGDTFRNSQAAADMTILTQRLSVLSGLDRVQIEDKMWQATMVGQHHDAWICFPHMFGHFKYDNYGAVIHACREEVADLMSEAIPVPNGPRFQVVNPTQHAQTAWLPLELTLPVGAVPGEVGLQNAEGIAVPARLQVSEQHPDGSAARVQGRARVDVAAFKSALYEVGGTPATDPLPVRTVQTQENEVEIANDKLHALLTKESIRLSRDNITWIEDLYLHAVVDGNEARSEVLTATATTLFDGSVCATAETMIGSIPGTIAITLHPWSDMFDIEINLDYDGQTTGRVKHWELEDSMKLVLVHDRPKRRLCQHPFELRSLTGSCHSAVHYLLVEQPDGQGIAVILDRPSGVIAEEQKTGIALCHSAKEDGCESILATGRKTYNITLLPYRAEEASHAVCAYQRQAYPLTVMGAECGALPIPDLTVQGHSIVSGLYREADAIFLRLWNPLETETVTIEAPGLKIGSTDLEGNILEELGTDNAQIHMQPMQITTLKLSLSQ